MQSINPDPDPDQQFAVLLLYLCRNKETMWLRNVSDLYIYILQLHMFYIINLLLLGQHCFSFWEFWLFEEFAIDSREVSCRAQYSKMNVPLPTV